MSVAGNFFVRWRVRLGYPLAVAVLYFSRPTPPSILLGALTGILGLGVRAYAAGCLHKQEVLTIAGPYAHTRNPLYLGSAILALGAGIATSSWISALILIVYFAVFYSIVMQREAKELQLRHGASFEDYARVAGRRRFLISSCGLAGDLAPPPPPALMLPRLPHLDMRRSK